MSDGVFRRPFSLPRPTQLPAIAALTDRAAVTVSFPPWKSPSLALSSIFQPEFELPRYTQTPIIATLSRVVVVVTVSFPPWKSPLLALSSIFQPEFMLSQSTQGSIPGTSAGVVTNKQPIRGFTRNVGRLMNP